MTEIRIEELRGTEAQYDHIDDAILLGNWSKPFSCPYAEISNASHDDIDRLLHVLNHELLHMAINRVADHRASMGLDWIISRVGRETWEGLP